MQIYKNNAANFIAINTLTGTFVKKENDNFKRCRALYS